MTSKERVLKAFARVKSDRVPIDYCANGVIHQKLKDHFRVTDDEALLQKLNVDFRNIDAPYAGPALFPEIKDRFVNPILGYYSRWIEHESGGYWDACDFPLQNADPEKIANYPIPDPDHFDYSQVESLCNQWRDYAIYVGTAGFCDIINNTGRVMGMEDILMNLQTEDEATLHYLHRRCKMELGRAHRIIEKAKGNVCFFMMGDDLGTQIAPMISLDLYRRVLKPFHKMYVDLAKSYNLPVLMHSCGYSSWAFEDFIEMGITGVDTLQPEVINMNPQYLVDHFGGRLSFHGCISTKGPVAYGTPDDVEADIKNIYNIMKPTYSYMFSPSHAIQDNSPLENVLRMYECGLKYGGY